MATAVIYAVLVFVPAVAFWAAVRGFEWFTRWYGFRSWRPRRVTADITVERLVDDLRRLDREYRVIQEQADLPARAARLRTVTLAYDDTLRACCQVLDLPQPARPPLGPVARLETEAALAQRGITW